MWPAGVDFKKVLKWCSKHQIFFGFFHFGVLTASFWRLVLYEIDPKFMALLSNALQPVKGWETPLLRVFLSLVIPQTISLSFYSKFYKFEIKQFYHSLCTLLTVLLVEVYFNFQAFVIGLTSDFIPKAVYIYVYSKDYTLEGYVSFTLSGKGTSRNDVTKIWRFSDPLPPLSN